MLVQVTNLNDFWEAIDAGDDSPYSLVIEGADNQCSLYVYNLQAKQVLAALLIPSSIKCPFIVDVQWNSDICNLRIASKISAEYDVKKLIGISNLSEWVKA